MKKMKLLTHVVFVLLLGFAMNSCKGDDGPAGADGIDGVDGQDGNANVTIVSIMATDITWSTGVYITSSSNVFTHNTTAVDQDIMDHGTVLGFGYSLWPATADMWLPLPFDYESGGITGYLTYAYALNNITLYAYLNDGNVWVPDYAFPEYRFLLITDNTVLGKSATKESVLEELKNAGIDVNNYFEVCDYYGINP